MTLTKKITLVLVLCLMAPPLHGRHLKIAVAGSAPFVKSDRKAVSGIAPEIWKEISYQGNFTFSFVSYPSVQKALAAVQMRRADFAIGPISITSQRAERVDFTQPYYQSSKAILVRQDSTSLWHTIKPFLRTTFLWAVTTLLLVLFGVGNLIWLVERRHNDNIARRYLPGVGSAMWFAVVTFTTVGYGDITPATRSGRLITGTWMIIALLTASSLTAGIASTFTLIQLRRASITEPRDVAERRVAVVRGTDAVDFARRYNASVHEVHNIKKALDLLRNKEVAAVISDFPILKYYSSREKQEGWKILPVHQDRDYYGFCTYRDHPLLGPVNIALIRAMEQGRIQKIIDVWL